MDFLTNAIQEGDYCALAFFSVILIFVGDRMIQSRPLLRIWGMRIAALAFVAFVVAHIVQAGSPTPSDLAMAAIVGLLGALVVLGPAWIVLAILGFFGGYYRNAANSANSAAHRRQLERERKEAEKRKRQEQIEWEKQAPQRERARLEAEMRQREESKRNADAKKIRSDARADCEMLYQLYAPEIDTRFPRASLDEWIKKYMGDDQSPSDVEQRADQLRKLIIHHREQVKPTPKFSTMADLATWFQEQKSQIETLPIEDRLRRMLLANLNVRNAELMATLLEQI